MSFLPLTLKLLPLTIQILVLVLILSREELQASAAGNIYADGRFSFEDSNCPQRWKRQLELEQPELKLERPSLELWTANGTKVLDRASPTVIRMGKEYQSEYGDGAGKVKMICKAPYPVILLAANKKRLGLWDEGDEFHVTITDNKSSSSFETQTKFTLPFDLNFMYWSDWEERNNIYYCQAVQNPCLKSREKLLYFDDSTSRVMSFTLRYYTFPSGSTSSDSQHHFVSDSNSDSGLILNPNSSSITTSELESIFGTNWNLNFNVNQSSLNSSSSWPTDQDQNQSKANNIPDSECEAFFYYEEFRDEPDITTEGRIKLRYRCKLSDGTPGTVQIFQRCGSWARCRFLVAARGKKAKNCWRPYTAGKTCLNCTAQSLIWRITEPLIPHCTAHRDEDESSEPEEDNDPEKEDVTQEPQMNDYLADVMTDESRETEPVTEDLLDDDNDDEKNDGKPSMSMSRSVEGTPLYVGFPPPGLEIQRPFIRTDAFDEDDLEEPTLVRMKPFPENQLFNTTLQIRCESNVYYTAKSLIFALEFKSDGAKGEGAQTNLHFLPGEETQPELSDMLSQYVFLVDKTALQERDYGNGDSNSQALTLHLNRTDMTRIFCFVAVQNSYKWINASKPIRVLKYADFYTPSECLDENDKNPDSDSDLAQKGHPKLSVFYSKPGVERTVEINEDNPQLFLNDGDTPAIKCDAPYPIQLLSTFNNIIEGGKFSSMVAHFETFENHSTYSFKMEGFAVKPKKESHFYRCQSLENPCLHQSIFYSYVSGRSGQFKFEHVPQIDKDNDSSTIERRRLKSNSLSGLEFNSPTNYSDPECEVLFFYKELADFPGYEFRCEFPMEEVGTVNFHYCDDLSDCGNLYRNRRQSKVCWRKVENGKKCRHCEEINRSIGFHPFVVTCTTNIYYEVEPTVIESTFGNFGVFGLPNLTTGIAPIYFSNEEIDSKATLFLEPFEEYQLFNTSLNVTCVSTAYYMSSEDVHIAKFYEKRNELQFQKESDGFNGDKFKVESEHNQWRITRNINLGNDPGLTHIFCIGITWLDIRKEVNSSQEIHLQAAAAPKITMNAGNFDEINMNLLETKNGQTSNIEEEYEFLVNSENQTLVCHGHGFPTPKIQWVTTAPNAPKPQETKLNPSHNVSRIFLPLIDAGVRGTYICTATNSQGTATASMRVSLKYPVNKSMVAIVTTSVLVVISLSLVMALLWKRNRGLMKQVRDLTPEEVEEFHLGSRTVDPDDPLAEIYALPYDSSLEIPRELIQLDETSVLGTGEFGLVRPGYIKEDLAREEKKLVAIKQAKPKLRAEDFKNILSEIKVMSHLKQHENVLQILAACTTSIKKCQVLVVMEFCEMGDLHKYLRDRKYVFEDLFVAASDPAFGYAPVSALMTDKFSTQTLVEFSVGIANGMNYLRQKRVVHGDLAARNVLLTKTLQVKVSDFGYSTHLINYASYTKNEQMVIPWRWFSIEALKEMKLSFKSDVWAFGVLLYEIFTLGELPYSGEDLSLEFVQDLTNGKRLEKPEYTNDEIYALMTDCWQKEPSERPTFQEIYDRLLLIQNELT